MKWGDSLGIHCLILAEGRVGLSTLASPFTAPIIIQDNNSTDDYSHIKKYKRIFLLSIFILKIGKE